MILVSLFYNNGYLLIIAIHTPIFFYTLLRRIQIKKKKIPSSDSSVVLAYVQITLPISGFSSSGDYHCKSNKYTYFLANILSKSIN